MERLHKSTYANALRQLVRKGGEGELLDRLFVSALIEARSCERFELLAPRLGQPLGSFYEALHRSEARHFELYLRLARRASNDAALCEQRLRQLAAVEAELITAADDVLRFHSGPAAALPA